MPNRILKESICTSDSIDSLSWFDEVFFYRLIVNCDDYGRCDARPKILKSKLFPLKEIREDQVVNALYRLSLASIIIVYMYDERPYLQLRTWGNHQQIRNKRSRYPELFDSMEISFREISKEKLTSKDFDSICDQMISSDYKCPRNPIQSESESESESNTDNCSEQEPSEPQDPPVITLQLNTGEEYGIFHEDIVIWSELYPAVDVMQNLRNMKGWLMANKAKRKTARGIIRFITGWLKKEQDRGGTPGYRPVNSQDQAAASKVEQFANSAREWAENG